MDMNEAVAKAIAAERTIAGVTVRQLASDAGIPERSLMRILGAEREINVNQVEKIAAAFKLYPHEIIEHAEQILERANRVAPELSNVVIANFGGDNVGGPSDNEHIGESWEVADAPVEYDGVMAAKKGTRKADDLPHAE